MLPTDCLEGNPGRLGPFPKLSAPVLFESLVVHELTHAYLDQTAGERFIPRIAHEFLAHAIQLGQLPEAERAQTLQEAAVSDPVELGDFNEAVLNFSPLRFAAMAWLHFENLGGDAEAVRRIIEGDLVFESLLE